MRLRFLNLLLAALLALSAARLWTALRAPQPELPPAPAAEATPATEPTSEESAGESAAGGGPEGYDAIVARDLFSATRGVIPPAPPAAAKPAPKPPVQPKLTLAGVVIVDGEKSAFIQEGTAEARPRKVREGEAFAGGTVKLIRPDGITFLFAGSEITVPLRTPKDGAGAPRPGEVPVTPVQPDVTQRRAGQPAFPAGAAGQVRRPPQPVPAVPRMMPAPVEEPVFDEEEMPIEDEGDIVDEDELLDEGEFPAEDFEDSAQ